MTKTIVTHDGTFHADEVTAIAIITQVIGEDYELFRSRDPEVWKSADYLIDVGLRYDPEKNLFDHHQAKKVDTFSKQHIIPLSSCGMVYKKYGKTYIKKVLSDSSVVKELGIRKDPETGGLDISPANIEETYKKFYRQVIEGIDALDNGVPQFKGDKKPREKYYVVNITRSIGKFNYKDQNNDDMQMRQFLKAMKYAKASLEREIVNIYDSVSSYKDDYLSVEKAMEKRSEIHHSQRIIYIEDDNKNWKRCLRDYEKRHKNNENFVKVWFVIYKGSCKDWGIRAFQEDLFKNRKDLISEEEAKKYLPNPEELITIHKDLFIAKATTFETIKEVAILSTEL